MARLHWFAALAVPVSIAVLLEACSGDDPDVTTAPEPDASVADTTAPPPKDYPTAETDASADAAEDSSVDAPIDAPVDAPPVDAGPPVTVEILGAFDAGSVEGSSAPINTFYQTKKIQWIVLAADLTAAGVPANAKIEGLELQASAVPALPIANFRIGLASTSATPDAVTAFPRAFYGATTLVYGPVTEAQARWTVGAWTSFAFTAPVAWNGTSNLLVETSFTLPDGGTTGGGLATRATARTNALVRYYAHSSTSYPFTGTNAINGGDALPAMRIVYRP